MLLRRRSVVLNCAAVGLALAGARASLATIAPYSNNFDSEPDGSQAGFTVYSGSSTSSTAFVVSNPTSSSGTFNNTSPLNTATSAALQFSNLGTGSGFVQSVSVTPTASGGALSSDYFGLAALATSANLTLADPVAANNTLYLADLQGSKAIRILKDLNGTTSNLVTGTFAGNVAIGTQNTLTLTGTYVGSALTLSLTVSDGTTSTTITAPAETTPLTGQYFGIRNRSSNTSGSSMTATNDNFAITPEPASCGLVLMSASGLLLRRRRAMR
jgi:hypothetical protein